MNGNFVLCMLHPYPPIFDIYMVKFYYDFCDGQTYVKNIFIASAEDVFQFYYDYHYEPIAESKDEVESLRRMLRKAHMTEIDNRLEIRKLKHQIEDLKLKMEELRY